MNYEGIKSLFQKRGSFEATKEEMLEKDGQLLSKIVMPDESITKLRYEFLLAPRGSGCEQHFVIRLWEYSGEKQYWSDIYADIFFGCQDTSKGKYLDGFDSRSMPWDWYVSKAKLLV